jgi:Phytanoyl-CoA dioxygenase (PhyH)
MIRPLFYDPALETEFIEKGFVKVPFEDPEVLLSILETMKTLEPGDGFDPTTNPAHNNPHTTYHCTFLDPSVPYKQRAHDFVREKFQDKINTVIRNFDILTSNFNIKPVGKGEFPMHQNWPTAHFQETTFTVWIPLLDVDVNNGTLHVVPGSHKMVPDIASATEIPFFRQIERQIIEKYMVPIEAKLGEAVFFCDSLVHWSPVNHSGKPRPIIQIITAPAEVQPLLFVPDAEDPATFQYYNVGPEFFTRYSIGNVIKRPLPAEAVLAGTMPNPNRVITEEEFRFRLEKGHEVRARLYAGEPVEFVPFAG